MNEETIEVPCEAETEAVAPAQQQEAVASAEAAEAEPEACPPRPVATGVAWWPFLVYLTSWAALVATTVYLLAGAQTALIPLENPVYPTLLFGAVMLTSFGPLLSVMVWLVAWFRSAPECRGGLLTTALVRGAGATLFGVVAWWAALVIIDGIRLGIFG